MEQYGPVGLARLVSGTVNEESSASAPVRSRYSELRIDSEVVGYLQTQINTKARDNAIRQLIWTLLVLAPFFARRVGTLWLSVFGHCDQTDRREFGHVA